MTEKKASLSSRRQTGARTAAPHQAASQTAPQRPAQALTKKLKSFEQKLDHTQDQLALVHGVLEELCERQEALAAWQMEFFKRMLHLDEAQWRALEDLAQTQFPVPKLKNPKRKQIEIAPEDDEPSDALDEATEYFDAMSKSLDERRNLRRKKQDKADTARRTSGDASEAPLESVLVLPTKSDLH